MNPMDYGHPHRYAICKICRCGIYQGQPRVWLTAPAGPVTHHLRT